VRARASAGARRAANVLLALYILSR